MATYRKQPTRRGLPGFPTGDLGDVTRLQLRLYFVLPFLVGFLLIVTSFLMKQGEFAHYRHPGWRIGVFAGGFSVIFIRYMVIVGSLLAMVWARNGWSITDKSKTANGFVAAFVILALGPMALFAWACSTYNDKLEMDALRKSGVLGRFRIQREEYVSGKGRHYSYHLTIADGARSPHDIELRRTEGGYLAAGDTVLLIYLAANPEYFREVSRVSADGEVFVLP